MYEDGQGLRMTVYVHAVATPWRRRSVLTAQDGVNGFYWYDDGWGYAVSCETSREVVLAAANAVYEQLAI
jgi:anti-sigma factor RsiW